MLMNVADPGKSAINSEHHVISYCLKMAVEGDKLMQKTCKWPKNWNNNFKTAESLSVKVHHIFENGIVNSLVVRKNGQITY